MVFQLGYFFITLGVIIYIYKNIDVDVLKYFFQFVFPSTESNCNFIRQVGTLIEVNKTKPLLLLNRTSISMATEHCCDFLFSCRYMDKEESGEDYYCHCPALNVVSDRFFRNFFFDYLADFASVDINNLLGM